MKNTKIKLNNMVFYLGYIFIIFSYMFSNVNGISRHCENIQKFAIILLIINILIQSKKYAKKQLIIVFGTTIVLLVSYYVSKSRIILLAWLLIATSKNIELRQFIKYDILIRCLFLIIIVSLYFAGLTENYFMYRSDGTIRSSMGVAHPNHFGAYLMIICLDYIYLKEEKIKFLDYILLVAVSFLVSYFSDSRTSQLGILAIIAILIINRFNKNKIFENKIIQICIKNIFLILSILIVTLSVMYKNNNGIAKKIDVISSARISLSAKAMENYNIKIFGNRIEFVSTKEALETKKRVFVLDNAYINIIMVYGIAAYLIILLSTYALNKKLLSEEQFVLLSILIVLYLYGFNETGLFKIQFNSFLICLSYIVYDKRFNVKAQENKEFTTNIKCGIR